MFVSIYFPVFDMRGYFLIRSTRTKRPTWPAPDLLSTPFQRNLGAIKDRPLGGVRGWAAECTICEVGRSVAFTTSRWRRDNLPMCAAFKRFYADGEGGAQFSIGVSVPLNECRTRKDQGQAISAILSAELRSRHLPGAVALREGGHLIANLFAGGTTKGNRLGDATSLVHHGRPLILLQGLQSDGIAGESTQVSQCSANGEAFAMRDLSRKLSTLLPGPAIMLDAAPAGRHAGRTARIIVARLYLELFVFERCEALLTSPTLEQMDAYGRDQLRARVALSAARLTGCCAPGITRGTDLYDQLGDAFAKAHRPGRIDELGNALRIIGASPNLTRAVVCTAERTDIINADETTAVLGGNYVTNNTYNNFGQAGAFGENAQATDFTQAWAVQAANVDLPTLAIELTRLQAALRAEATTGAELATVTAIVHAKEAAEAGNGPSVLDHLAQAGKWALSVAEKIGVGLVVALIKSRAGL